MREAPSGENVTNGTTIPLSRARLSGTLEPRVARIQTISLPLKMDAAAMGEKRNHPQIASFFPDGQSAFPKRLSGVAAAA
jgi:hypothetical protein